MHSRYVKIISIVVVIAVVIGLVFFANEYRKNSPQSDNSDNVAILNRNKIEVKSTPEDKPAAEISTQPENISSEPVPTQNNTDNQMQKVEVESGFIPYNESKLVNAENGRVVLFFHAPWCPSCRGLENDIVSNQNNIPKDLLILKVDYDSSTELKNKYQVVQQHTLVQVDKNGNAIRSNKGLYQLDTLESVNSAFPIA